MADTQIPIDPETREKLKWVKLLSVSGSYTETVEKLIKEAGYDVPSEPMDEANTKRLVLGDN